MIDLFSISVGILNYINLKRKHIQVGLNFKLKGYLLVQGTGTTIIGNNVTIYSQYSVNPIGGDKTTLQVMNGAQLLIGNHVGISHANICCHNNIQIDDNVLIGGGVKIYDTDFHSLEYEKRMEKPDLNVKTSPIHIKKGAFIGAHSIILKGVTIGEKSVVGAGSVVVNNVPDGEIWGGNPAKFIRKLVSLDMMV